MDLWTDLITTQKIITELIELFLLSCLAARSNRALDRHAGFPH